MPEKSEVDRAIEHMPQGGIVGIIRQGKFEKAFTISFRQLLSDGYIKETLTNLGNLLADQYKRHGQ